MNPIDGKIQTEKIGGGNYLDMYFEMYYNESYVIHIREFFEYQNGESVSPPTFFNLYFKNFNGNWKITGFDFDV